MGLSEIVASVTDPYERKARLWPALLAGLPIFVLVALLYAPTGDTPEKIGMLVVSCGGLYLLANICREFGKRLEPRLFEEWGGKPSTQLLRHRNSGIESVTKRRYHEFLTAKIRTNFPTAAEETSNPVAADETYQSAVRWLLDHTRDPTKFGLLLKENIEYGFRRNALGLKPVAIFLGVLVLAWIPFAHGQLLQSLGHTILGIESTQSLSVNAVVVLVVALTMTLVWTFFFTPQRVRNAAFTYADVLLRACDCLE
ncbi:MAG: hypothetical protein ACKVQK_03445 [Burkholderiales bacterium]